jgi:hypothetical protein
VSFRVDDVHPAFVGARNDVLARGREEGHCGCLLGVLRGLLLGCVVAFDLGATGRRGDLVLDRDLVGHVDDDGLIVEEGGDEAHVVLGVQLGDEDGGLEADGAHAGAILQVPKHALPVLPGAQDVAVVGGPAQRLDLARVAAQLAGDAIRLNVEDDDDSIVLQQVSSERRIRTRTRTGRRVPVQRPVGRRGG